MGLFNRNNRNGGMMDMIRCDEPSYLIWKWHPAGSQAGQNTRENAIRWGSSLRVKDGEVAVWDPMLNPGRYDVPGRKGKVRLDGTDAYADFDVIRQDCKDRPFFLFWKE